MPFNRYKHLCYVQNKPNLHATFIVICLKTVSNSTYIFICLQTVSNGTTLHIYPIFTQKQIEFEHIEYNVE